jgi:serine protease AprX
VARLKWSAALLAIRSNMNKLSLVFILIVTTALAEAPLKSKLSRELSSGSQQGDVKVIVQWKVVPTAEHDEKVVRRGGTVKHHLELIKAGSYSIPAAALADLASEPDVAYISLDRPIKGSLDYSAAAVNAKTAWLAGYLGTGIGVAVLDSGMVQSPDLTLNNNILYNADFTGEIKQNVNVGDPHNAPDQYGHGQHVAGIIASSGKSSLCGKCTRALVGIAPGANLINMRVLDENGNGTDSGVIAAIEKAISLKSKYNIRGGCK